MTHAVIQVDVARLKFPLRTVETRFGASYSMKLVGVPADFGGVFVRVFTQGDGYYDCPANQNDNGDWFCYIIGTCFPNVCEAKYEVHALDGYGNNTALGVGKLVVEPFSAGSTPIENGSEVSVATLPDAQGALHQVVAVNLGTAENPDWSWQVKTVNGAS